MENRLITDRRTAIKPPKIFDLADLLRLDSSSTSTSNFNLSSPMHPCLRLPEIQLLICTQVRLIYEHGRSTEGYRTLYDLALSCKAFFEPAMANLWRWQIKLTPVLLCLPEDLIVTKKGKRRIREITVRVFCVVKELHLYIDCLSV